MTEATHTPTPWFSFQDEDDRFDGDKIIITNLEREGENIVPIAQIPSVDDDGDFANEQRANAVFIVRAVNCHSDLVAALTEVMEWIANWDPNFVEDDEWRDTKVRVDEALAYAGASL